MAAANQTPAAPVKSKPAGPAPDSAAPAPRVISKQVFSDFASL